MILPIATDTSVRRTPWVNYGLIGACAFIYMVESLLGGPRGSQAVASLINHGVLQGDEPRLFQFFTYQFLHADLLHLGGNMLFLWLFGNAVNAKMGHLPYLLFYLAGGEAAAIGYLINHDSAMVGASGAIAAVTTAYLALFPRSRITILYWWFFIGTFELPSMIMIVFKMIIWDNIIAKSFGGAMSNVAFDAHLAGYAFGFAGTVVLLAIGALPRDQFDLIALWRRWIQRQSIRGAMADPQAQARAQFGRVARPVSLDDLSVKVSDALADDPVTELRGQIMSALERGDRDEAASLYERLMEMDPRQVLGRGQQMDVANHLYGTHRFPQAAAAYEKFLVHYPSSPETPHLRLLLGIIYARDLHQYEVAEEHLKSSLDRLTDDRRREQAAHWLKVARDALGRPATQA